jgi:hypothetical protein
MAHLYFASSRSMVLTYPEGEIERVNKIFACIQSRAFHLQLRNIVLCVFHLHAEPM